MAKPRAFIFHISIPCDKTLPSYQVQSHQSRSRSNIKVAILKRNGCYRGISVSQTQLVHHDLPLKGFSGLSALLLLDNFYLLP